MGKMMETLQIGVIIFGGLLFLKAIGGIKGLTGIFSGIGGLLGVGDGVVTAASTVIPGGTIEEIAALEEKLEEISPAGKEFMARETAIETGIPGIGWPQDIIPEWLPTPPFITIGTELMETLKAVTKDSSRQAYLNDIAEAAEGESKQQVAALRQEAAVEIAQEIVTPQPFRQQIYSILEIQKRLRESV